MRILAWLTVMIVTGCGDISSLPDDPPTPQQSVAEAGQAPVPSGGVGIATADCRPDPIRSPALPCDPDLRFRTEVTPLASQEFYRQTRDNAARRDTQIQDRNRELLIRSQPDLARPGEQQALARSRITMQQEDLRAQRDRLRDAPYAQTIGGIGY